jgi:IclR family pca regulon transcriptional regulator
MSTDSRGQDMHQRKPKHFINSLARGLKILAAFSADNPRLTLQELSDLSGFNKTAVQRLTDTLMALGYLGRNRRKEFYLEARILTLGFSYLNGSELRLLGETRLRAFSRRIGQTVNLAVLDELDVIFVYRNEIRRFFSFGLREGSKLPSYCTSSGKVLLAALPDDELDDRLDRIVFEPLTRYTISNKQTLREGIEAVRRGGYAIADQEGTLALYSIAVPVFNYEDRVVAAANISLPAEEHDPSDLRKMLDALREEGAHLSASLGYNADYPGPPFSGQGT